jgi:hypothetical protein
MNDEEFKSEVKKYSNNQLFDEYVRLLPGDDYDGGFTNQGRKDLEILDNEIRERLAGWLNE